MRKWITIAFMALCNGAIPSAFASDFAAALTPDEVRQEIVMPKGSTIQATTQEGVITIRAGEDYVRIFEWDGASRSAQMKARAKPWYGTLGIFCPGESGMWRKHHGISRVVYAEYRLSYSTKGEAERYIAEQWGKHVENYSDDSDDLPAGVWNDQGLLVRWSRKPGAEYLGVTVVQVIIAGKIPNGLLGSQDRNLITTP
jgi:hypothetical protein